MPEPGKRADPAESLRLQLHSLGYLTPKQSNILRRLSSDHRMPAVWAKIAEKFEELVAKDRLEWTHLVESKMQFMRGIALQIVNTYELIYNLDDAIKNDRDEDLEVNRQSANAKDLCKFVREKMFSPKMLYSSHSMSDELAADVVNEIEYNQRLANLLSELEWLS
jgi:hypothetical protein